LYKKEALTFLKLEITLTYKIKYLRDGKSRITAKLYISKFFSCNSDISIMSGFDITLLWSFKGRGENHYRPRKMPKKY